MKSLPFKEGLEEWKKTDESIQLARAIINSPKPAPPRIIYKEPSKTSRKAERVIHGEVKWKPMNRQAAMLLSSAPWWAHPIPDIKELRKQQEVKTVKQKKIRKHKNMGFQNETPGAMTSGDVRVEVIGGVEMINLNDLAVKVIAEINKQPQQLTPLARAAIDARNVASENINGLGGMVEDFKARSKVCLEDIRQTRFSIVSETSLMISPLKEVRQFFLGSDYKEEITRLREFVDLCERLKTLKESGILDAIGDTMIKLATKHES